MVNYVLDYFGACPAVLNSERTVSLVQDICALTVRVIVVELRHTVVAVRPMGGLLSVLLDGKVA